MVESHSNKRGQGGPHGSKVVPHRRRLPGAALQTTGLTCRSSGRSAAGFARCVPPLM